MGYIDKYVALKQEDFKLSLWGGDVVLNKLDLRLDAIENALALPVTFKSGHINALRIHVPWTTLGSQPVRITVDTIECILKLRDTAPKPTRPPSVSSSDIAAANKKVSFIKINAFHGSNTICHRQIELLPWKEVFSTQ